MAIGVAALTGVRGFSDSFERTLLGEARTIMAADLSARMFRQPTGQEEQQLNALAAAGVDRTEVTEMTSMALSPADPVPLLISLKVVDPRKYPFYGSVLLDPAGDLGTLLTDSTVVVAEDLLIRLHTQVGASTENRRCKLSHFRGSGARTGPHEFRHGPGPARADERRGACQERPIAAGKPRRRALSVQAACLRKQH